MSRKTNKSGSHADKDHGRTPPRRFTRRAWIGTAGAGAVALVLGRRFWSRSITSDLAAVTVYKDPNCQCCHKWVGHMRDAGFTVVDRNTSDVGAVKRERGVPQDLVSCHTSVVDGYVFEGHVPADLVEQVLRQRPSLAGLAVPGMPQSAPGMDIGHERYDVWSFTRDGKTALFAARS